MQEIPQSPRSADRLFTTSTPSIAYRLRDGSDDIVVLLHGVGSSASTWDELIPLIDERYTVLAPDYRGHGLSDAPDGPYDIQDFVDDFFRLLDELGVDAVHVVGFSIGAIIAQAIALAQPTRVRSLVLLNTIGARTDDEKARALDRYDVIRTTDPADTAVASAARWFTPAFRASHPDLVQGEVDIVSAVRHAPYAATYEVLATTELIDQVHRIRCPILIITGENDVGSTPRMSRAVHDETPGSELVVVDDLQHYLHIEAASQIAELITGFLRALPPITTTTKSPIK